MGKLLLFILGMISVPIILTLLGDLALSMLITPGLFVCVLTVVVIVLLIRKLTR